jgi:TonB-linked SusC/RagA family outer membrane protein
VFKRSGADGILGYAESRNKRRNWYMESALSYERDFGPHSVTGLLLYNQSKTFYPSQFTEIPVGYVGMAARTTYNYKLKYMLDLNLGYNGSENFAEDRRFGFFPAVSVAWTPTEENFLKDRINFLGYLKFRYSYGIVGNDRLGGNRFLYLPDSYVAQAPGYNFGDTNPLILTGSREGTLGNPFVTWETATKQNFGVDFTVLNSKLSVSVDRFYEHRDNILTTRNTVPVVLSMSLPALNIGEVENQGYEGEIRWRDRAGNVSYYITANMSFARNKVLYMDEIPQNEPYLHRTGLPINQRFGYVFDGFWTQEDIDRLDQFADAGYIPRPGDARYKDLNNDGILDSDDRMPIGFPDFPEYIASVNSGFSFKGFDFSMLWTGVTNTSRVVTNTLRVPFETVGNRALSTWLYENSWTPETAETALAPRITFTGRVNNTRDSDLWVRDASYIRLKNIELGYTIRPQLLSRFGISRLRIYGNGYNLLTFDHLEFMDPEGVGRDYPVVKILNFGINATF